MKSSFISQNSGFVSANEFFLSSRRSIVFLTLDSSSDLRTRIFPISVPAYTTHAWLLTAIVPDPGRREVVLLYVSIPVRHHKDMKYQLLIQRISWITGMDVSTHALELSFLANSIACVGTEGEVVVFGASPLDRNLYIASVNTTSSVACIGEVISIHVDATRGVGAPIPVQYDPSWVVWDVLSGSAFQLDASFLYVQSQQIEVEPHSLCPVWNGNMQVLDKQGNLRELFGSNICWKAELTGRDLPTSAVVVGGELYSLTSELHVEVSHIS